MSSTAASASFIWPAPGSMPSRLPIGPILRMASICSRKSSSVSSPVPILAAAASACWASKTCSACSIRVSTSPMPRMRLAIRSGWKTSKSSSFSPADANRIGTPVTSRTDSAAPPRASPSSLVSTTPVNPTPSRNASAVVTASWPIIASSTNSTSSGSTASRIAGGLAHQFFVDAEPARGVHDHDVEVPGPGLGETAGRDRDGVTGTRVAPSLPRTRRDAGRRPPHRPVRRRSAAG